MGINTRGVAFTAILLAAGLISAILAYQNHVLAQELQSIINELESDIETQKNEYETRIANLVQMPKAESFSYTQRPLSKQSRGSSAVTRPQPALDLNDVFVSQALDAFDNLDPGTRAAALRELARLAHLANDTRAREILLSSLHDQNPKIRLEAARGIGLLQDPDLIYTLEPMANDPDPAVRRAVLDAVVRSSHSPDLSGPVVSKFLHDTDEKIARKALRNIARLNYQQALDLVSELTQSENLEIAASAGFTARSLGDDASADNAVTYLAQGLESSDSRERSKALDRIGNVGGRAAIPYLESALLDPDPEVRSDAQFYLNDLKLLIEIQG